MKDICDCLVPDGLVVVGPRLIRWHPVLLHLVTVQHSRLGGLVATDVTRVPHALVLRPLVQLGVQRSCPHIITLITVVLDARVLGHLVPVQAAQLREGGRAEVTGVHLAHVRRLVRADALVLSLLVPDQAALLGRDVGALVTRVLPLVLDRLLLRLCWLRLDAAGLPGGAVHLVEAVPEKQTSTNEHFPGFESLLTHLA